MDTDLKPVQAPLVDPEQPTDSTSMPDPFKPDNPPLTPGPRKKHHGGKGSKVVLLIVLILALIGATGYGVYYWQHKEVKKANARIQELNNEVTSLQDQVNSLEATDQALEKEVETEATPSTDTLITDAVKAYCQTTIDPASKQAHVFTLVNSAGNKQVLFSTDKTFATVNATCGTTAAPGATQTYYVKQSGGEWVVVHAGALTPAVTNTFNIPTAFN